MLKNIINKLISSTGYVLLSKRQLSEHKLIKEISAYDHANARGKAGLGLNKFLKENNLNKWLEVGTGGRDDDGFIKVDIKEYPEGKTPLNYRRLDIINCTDAEIENMGKFDFIRMQHVFEHFTPEDGLEVLNNCAKLLNSGGYILMSCPDIDIVIKEYTQGDIRKLNNGWGKERIGTDAPDSFVFSIFTHSVLSEPHMWCYNGEGLVHQLKKTNQYVDIEILSLTHPLACIPFTHNRPDEDVVVLAKRK